MATTRSEYELTPVKFSRLTTRGLILGLSLSQVIVLAVAAVVFVTHDVNPIIEHVDRILYLANGSFRIGTPDQVLRSDVLSELYGTRVEVLRSNGRILVAGRPDSSHYTDSPEELIL